MLVVYPELHLAPPVGFYHCHIIATTQYVTTNLRLLCILSSLASVPTGTRRRSHWAYRHIIRVEDRTDQI